jgi:hypothetical protein
LSSGKTQSIEPRVIPGSDKVRNEESNLKVYK